MPEPTTAQDAWAQAFDATKGDAATKTAAANAARKAFNERVLTTPSGPTNGGGDFFGLGAGFGALGQSLVEQASSAEPTIDDAVSMAALVNGLGPEATAALQQWWASGQAADLSGTGPSLSYANLMSMAEELAKKTGVAAGGGTSAVSAYNAQRQFWQDQIDAGLATVEQAENAFTRWVNEEGVKLGYEQESGQRASDINAILEKRARETMPEETIGGLNALIGKVSGNLGLPSVKLPAQPASSYPDVWATYQQAKSGLQPSASPEVPFFQVPPPPGPGGAAVEGYGAVAPAAVNNAQTGSAGIDDYIRQLAQRAGLNLGGMFG